MNGIEELLPHRKPFLFVDRLLTVNDANIVGEKTFADSEYFFEGHFPDYPIVPGVIIIETLAQCGGAGIRQSGILGDSLFFLASVEKAKFRKEIRPGTTVRLEIENIKVSPRIIKQRGKAFIGTELAAEAEWLCLVQTQKEV